MKKITLIIITSLLFSSAFAIKPLNESVVVAPKKWTKGGSFTLNFSETGYQNWATVTDNVVTANNLLSLFAKYNQGKMSWENYLDVAYGQSRLSSIGSFRKSDDKIDFTSKFGYKASKTLYYTALFNFKSQIMPGYTYLTNYKGVKDSAQINSKFMAPGRIELSLGIDYKPNESFSLFFSPLANRLTICTDTLLAPLYLKVRPQDIDKATGKRNGGTKTSRYELGASLKMLYQKDIMKNVNLKTRIELFTDYLDNQHNVDVFGDLILAMKVNKYISASVGATLIYDDDTAVPLKSIVNGVDGYNGKLGPRTQFRHTFGIGLAYKF
jgi:hypothetical protein